MVETYLAPSSASRTTHFNLDPIFTYPAINDRGENLLRQITSIYEAGNPPEQSTLMLDGTYSILMRSYQRTCATDLSAPLPLPAPTVDASIASESKDSTPTPTDQHLATPVFQECRKCSGKYVFRLPGGAGSVTVIAGAPESNVVPAVPYKTMSYVWGALPSSPLSIPCLQCNHITSVPMLSAQRFRNLMYLGGAGNTIWLDAVSIDQTSKDDIAAHIAIMGTIYKNATCVSVLLPASDRAAYECLEAIERDAKIILMHRQNFILNSDFTIEDPNGGETINVLSTVCQMFLENLKNLGEHLHQFAYWSRAWTFQEWALASDLEIAVEGWSKPDTCFNMKSLVLGAAMLISRYKILQHQHAEIKLGNNVSRGMVPPIFNNIKAIFPDEDLFLSYEEIDGKKVSFQANFPHVGVTDLLGIRSVPAPTTPSAESGTEAPTPNALALSSRPTQLAQTRARLILLLSAFASSKRSAKYEADLVACWASMCNIAYPYDRNDDFSTARRKAMNALRDQGMVVYDFVPDTRYANGEEGVSLSPVDIFRAYAREHPQLNATNNAEFPGAPIFTGRADTVMHLIYSLERISLPTEWIDDDSVNTHHGETKTILDSKIDEIIALDGDLGRAMNSLADKAVYGRIPGLAGFQFWETQDVAKLYLEKVLIERRAMAKLVIAQIQFHKYHDSAPPLPCDLYLWGIVPNDIPVDSLAICREPVNGALVLDLSKNGHHHIASYLVLSDHLSGSFLVTTDEKGKVDLELRIPERGDMMNSAYRQVAVRKLCGEVRLGSTGTDVSTRET